MGAGLGCLLAILVALHRIVVRIAGGDASRLGLVAGGDAGISIIALGPGHSTRYDHHPQDHDYSQ